MKISTGSQVNLEPLGNISSGIVFTLDTVVYIKGASRYSSPNQPYTCECTTLKGGTQQKLAGDKMVRTHKSAELFLND